MKISKVLSRWYKSFNVNYVGYPDRRGGVIQRPWNMLGSATAGRTDFPFIEIPVEDDITTIVGANESGKSHLIGAISKVLTGQGILENPYSRTDLCHFASVKNKNASVWPNVGLEFRLDNDAELQKILDAAGSNTGPLRRQEELPRIVLILSPEDSKTQALLYVGHNDPPLNLNAKQLEAVRQVLPAVRFIDSNVAMSDQVPLINILAAYDAKQYSKQPFYDYAVAQQAAELIKQLKVTKAQPVTEEEYQKLVETRQKLEEWRLDVRNGVNLEVLLFRDILGITLETLQYLSTLRSIDRSYIESLIATWNQELAEKLNLSHYWQQDEKFSLQLNYKQGVIFFEITDKTKCIYTFRERSSGLRYFLSYYIQAKALELSQGNRNCVILMDEPDCYLSTLGQKNLLAVFESLVSPDSSLGTCQLIYTTHSPFLINRNFPRRIRLLRKGDAEEGSQFIDQAMVRRYEPVRSALGIDCAQTLFMGSTNLLLEGPTDQFLFTESIRLFATPENTGDHLDLNSVTVVSAESAPGVEKLLAASQWGDETVPATVVLLDSDPSGGEALKRITGQAKNTKKLIDKEFCLSVGEVIKPFGTNQRIATTEDIIPQSLYGQAVLGYLKRWHPELVEGKEEKVTRALEAKDFSKDGLAIGIEKLLENDLKLPSGSYDKMGILQELIRIVGQLIEREVKDAELVAFQGNVVALCQTLRRKIEISQQAARRRSGKQSVQRIIHDFFVIHKHSASTLDVQVLLERLDGEAESLGVDGEKLKVALASWLQDIEVARTSGQGRLAPKDWEHWAQIIESIKHNPLDPLAASRLAGAAQVNLGPQSAPKTPLQSAGTPPSIPARQDAGQAVQEATRKSE